MTPPPSPAAAGAADAPDPARDDAWIRALRTALLDFFDARARDLPWRRTDDPYAIWVSEVMLQQTRVETVIPYWEAWMARYPTPAALADAPREEVLKAWEGLGYYSRARNLHKAAAVVREEHGGRLPDTVDGLRALPGVGAYTAGAVASIAFGIPAPAVDGNVRRVAARLLDWPDPTPARLEKVVEAWVPGAAGDRPNPEGGTGGPSERERENAPGTARPNPAGDFNQALMELGATICTPRNPGCYTCPVADLCAAKAAGTVADRPAPKKRARVREEERVVEVRVRLDGARTPAFLLRKRPPEGLLAGMFEFPSRILEEGPGEPGTTLAATGAVGRSGHDSPPRGRPLEPVHHVFTHLRVAYRPFLHVLEARASDDRRTGEPASDGSGAEADWYPLHEIRKLPMPVAQQKILERALRALAQPEL